ncbi:MAG TPA: WYL domain-containing protein, partial [Ktedonobacteraceae bacterium]|nr:WYL domain-containing protein [Ktedonobacteraceae bacterium]
MRTDTLTERANRRRLALLVLLHHHPRRYGELIAALDRDTLFSYDRASDAIVVARQQRHQFRNDIQALRLLSCDIYYDRRTGCYSWKNSPFGLFLNQEQLATFILLLNTFNETTILHAHDIQALLSFLVERRPVEQQKVIANQRAAFSIDLHETTDYRDADPHNIKRIEQAIAGKRQLQFAYRSPRAGQERRHAIEPEPLVFEHGHVYLYGWSLDHQKRLQFRLDYIIPGSAEVLHITIVRSRPAPISYILKYRLSPIIARNSVSQHFPGQQVETHPDGSATV